MGLYCTIDSLKSVWWHYSSANIEKTPPTTYQQDQILTGCWLWDIVEIVTTASASCIIPGKLRTRPIILNLHDHTNGAICGSVNIRIGIWTTLRTGKRMIHSSRAKKSVTLTYSELPITILFMSVWFSLHILYSSFVVMFLILW